MTADRRGEGFAWARQQSRDPWWVILVANYGLFLFYGSEEAAEAARAHKSNAEQAIAHKRPASIADFAEPSACWNHRGFVRLYWYGSRGRRLKRPYSPRFACDCGSCAT